MFHEKKLLILNIYSDNVPTSLVDSWPLTTDMWDGELLAGPVPSLFTSEPEAACTAINEGLVKIHADISKLLKVFFIPEHLYLDEALLLLKDSR
jgi:hypothetical protein